MGLSKQMTILAGVRRRSMDGERLLSRLRLMIRVLMIAKCRVGSNIDKSLKKLKMLFIGTYILLSGGAL